MFFVLFCFVFNLKENVGARPLSESFLSSDFPPVVFSYLGPRSQFRKAQTVSETWYLLIQLYSLQNLHEVVGPGKAYAISLEQRPVFSVTRATRGQTSSELEV